MPGPVKESVPNAIEAFSEAFDVHHAAWTIEAVNEAGDEACVRARIHADALRERLDTHLGVNGWGVRYTSMEGGACACHLQLGGVTKGAVVNAARVGGAQETAALALSAAASLWGARFAQPLPERAWVPFDAESGELLHTPELNTHDVDARAAAPGVAAAAATAVAATVEPEAVVEKPQGQQMIDRLIERLKEEGQGLAAARLLVQHGGYGKDPQAARELYAALRQLLMQPSA